MNTLFLISTTAIPDEQLIKDVQNVASTLQLSFARIDEEAVSVSVPNFGDLLEIALSDFEKTMHDQSFKPGYGEVLSIWYNNNGPKEDSTVIPFLKEFLKIHPFMLVYNDDIAGNDAYIFSKSQIDALKGNECAYLFEKPIN